MECPYCGGDSRVLDSRGSAAKIRRRRECLACRRRFTTYEELAQPEIRVLKRDGDTEPFDREKLRRVLERLTRGRPITEAQRTQIVRELEAQLVDEGTPLVSSRLLARRLLDRLRPLDELSAARFESNYKQDDGSIAFGEDPAAPQLPLPLPVAALPAAPVRRRARK